MVVTASVGVLHQADGRSSPGDLLRWVDLAMYRAKSFGGDTIEMDDPADRAGQSSSMRRVAELRQAVHDEELLVHYQGEWDLESGQLLGAEALARWDHPTEGLLVAGEFIPLAEATGLIDELGARVLREACRAAAPWVETFAPGEFVLRVNRGPAAAPAGARRPGGRCPARRRAAGRGAVPRAHREHPPCRPGRLGGAVRPAAPPGRGPGHRRLRHRLLARSPAQAAAAGPREDRPGVRRRPPRRQQRPRHRPGHVGAGRLPDITVTAEGVETEGNAPGARPGLPPSTGLPAGATRAGGRLRRAGGGVGTLSP